MDSLPDSPGQTSFLFDLDGTLIDSVYQHVLAWREALQSVGVSLAVWKIHRRIGMSGGLFVNALVARARDAAGRRRRWPRSRGCTPTRSSAAMTRSRRCRARGSC